MNITNKDEIIIYGTNTKYRLQIPFVFLLSVYIRTLCTHLKCIQIKYASKFVYLSPHFSDHDTLCIIVCLELRMALESIKKSISKKIKLKN